MYLGTVGSLSLCTLAQSYDICAGTERIPGKKLAPSWILWDEKMGPGTIEYARPFNGLAFREEKIRGRPA